MSGTGKNSEISLNMSRSMFHRKAIYDRPAPESAFMSKEAGRVAWLFWRSAYFTKTLSVRNK